MQMRVIGFAALFLSAQAAAQAQTAAPPPAPTLQQLLNSGYDLKTVLLSAGPCGDQQANRGQSCRRELLFLQSARKDAVFRCELGTWNGRVMQECRRLG